MIEVYFVSATNPLGVPLEEVTEFFRMDISEQRLTSIDFLNTEGQNLKISMFLDDWLRKNLLSRPTVYHDVEGYPYQLEDVEIDIWSYAILIRRDNESYFIGYLVDWDYTIDETTQIITFRFIDGVSLMKRLGERRHKSRLPNGYVDYRTILENFVTICSRFQVGNSETSIFDNIIYQYNETLGLTESNFKIFGIKDIYDNWEEEDCQYRKGFKEYNGDLYIYFVKYKRWERTQGATILRERLIYKIIKIENNVGIANYDEFDISTYHPVTYESEEELQEILEYFYSDEYANDSVSDDYSFLGDSLYKKYAEGDIIPNWNNANIPQYTYDGNEYNINSDGDVYFSGTVLLNSIKFKDNTADFNVSDVLGEILKIHDIGMYIKHNNLNIINKDLSYNSYEEIHIDEIIGLKRRGKVYRGNIRFPDLDMPNIETLKEKQVDELLGNIKYEVEFSSFLNLEIGDVYNIDGALIKISGKKLDRAGIIRYRGWQI